MFCTSSVQWDSKDPHVKKNVQISTTGSKMIIKSVVMLTKCLLYAELTVCQLAHNCTCELPNTS